MDIVYLRQGIIMAHSALVAWWWEGLLQSGQGIK